jgi:hypothetical protein
LPPDQIINYQIQLLSHISSKAAFLGFLNLGFFAASKNPSSEKVRQIFRKKNIFGESFITF